MSESAVFAGDFDLAASPLLRDALPGLVAALDPAAAGRMLDQAVATPGSTVERCRPGKALYLGAGGCGLRFETEIRDGAGYRRPLLFLARVLPDDHALAAYEAAVARVAERATGRLSMGGARPWAVLPGRLVVHRFPIDPELPTLTDATDPRSVARALHGVVDGLEGAQVALGHYGRRHRCVLRYDCDPERGRSAPVYGKVWADDRGAAIADAVARIPGRVGPARVPRVHAYVPELRLAVFEALAGAPALSAALAGTGPTPVSLVATAAAVAAGLHGSGLTLPTTRPIEVEMAELRGLVDMMAIVAPDVAAGLDRLLTDIDASASSTSALALVPTHGDFTPSQLLTDGEGCGLVDFDSMALAEPALDLGQYLAYLRLAGAKTGLTVDDVEELGRAFRDDYARAAGITSVEASAARTRVYGCVSLLRTTLHAWQKLKPKRAALVFRSLVQEVACLPSAA